MGDPEQQLLWFARTLPSGGIETMPVDARGYARMRFTRWYAKLAMSLTLGSRPDWKHGHFGFDPDASPLTCARRILRNGADPSTRTLPHAGMLRNPPDLRQRTADVATVRLRRL
jgi:hypothetical protein